MIIDASKMNIMSPKPWILRCLSLLTIPFIMHAEKIKVETEADLPRADFALNAMPSEILQRRGELLDALMMSVEEDATKVLEGYQIEDGSTRVGLLNALYAVAFLRKDWPHVLELGKQIRAAENKEANRYLSNNSTDSYAAAALKAGNDASEAFRDAIASDYRERLEAMPFELVQDSLQSAASQFELVTMPLLEGQMIASLDPNAEARDGVVDRRFALSILNMIKIAELIPVMDVLSNTINAYLDANETEKEDLWTERQVELTAVEGLTPVVTAVWDSGTDIKLFPDQRWINQSELANGKDDDANGFADDLSGIAFDKDNRPTAGSLMQLPESDYADLDTSLEWIVGAMDMQANLDSEAARNYRKTVTSLSPEEVQPFMLRMARLGLYTHGTMTAYTTAEDNPAIRLMYVRFSFDAKPVPDPFDEAYAASFVEYIDSVFAYLREAKVRVVNMSWRVTTPMIEGSLAAVEPDSNKRKERSLKIFATMSGAMEAAIRSMPDVLFIAGAGNEDEDVDFVKSFPAGFDLPNLITVGAVDISLQPASFTSFGKSIDIYANGFEVKTRMPGGKKTMISGTSLAAPQVANLAAKLLALEPTLTVSELRELIEGSATAEGDSAIKVIHPKAAMAALKNQ
jgi:hypothetical protein